MKSKNFKVEEGNTTVPCYAELASRTKWWRYLWGRAIGLGVINRLRSEACFELLKLPLSLSKTKAFP